MIDNKQSPTLALLPKEHTVGSMVVADLGLAVEIRQLRADGTTYDPIALLSFRRASELKQALNKLFSIDSEQLDRR